MQQVKNKIKKNVKLYARYFPAFYLATNVTLWGLPWYLLVLPMEIFFSYCREWSSLLLFAIWKVCFSWGQWFYGNIRQKRVTKHLLRDKLRENVVHISRLLYAKNGRNHFNRLIETVAESIDIGKDFHERWKSESILNFIHVINIVTRDV